MQNGPPLIPPLIVTTSTHPQSGDQTILINPNIRDPEVAFGHWIMWGFFLFCGITFLPVEYLYFDLVSTGVGLLALVSTAIGAIGLSTYISAYFDEPKYNLGKQLVQFMKDHKLLTLCVGVGTLMLNPISIILGVGIGIVAEIMLPTVLEKFFEQKNSIINGVKEQSQGVLNFFRQWRQQPMHTLSAVAGSIVGLKLFTHYFPKIFPTLFDLAISSFHLIRAASSEITRSLTGGVVPHLLILMASAVLLTLATMAAMLILPAVAIVGGGWSSYKVWDALHWAGNKIKTKKVPVPVQPPVVVTPVLIDDPLPKKPRRSSRVKEKAPAAENPIAQRTRHKKKQPLR